jgi:hypothetical protein
VVRVWIPKPDGRQRPIGIAALEDKIVQQAVAWVLQAIYEQDFLGFSSGFRPDRSQHQALDALTVAISERQVNWGLDADIPTLTFAIAPDSRQEPDEIVLHVRICAGGRRQRRSLPRSPVWGRRASSGCTETHGLQKGYS